VAVFLSSSQISALDRMLHNPKWKPQLSGFCAIRTCFVESFHVLREIRDMQKQMECFISPILFLLLCLSNWDKFRQYYEQLELSGLEDHPQFAYSFVKRNKMGKTACSGQ
jgi:hypothetical protein